MNDTTKTTNTTTKTCLCGCGQPTKGTFAMGHDARMVSQLRAAVLDKKTTRAAALKKLPSDALKAKLSRALNNAAKPEPAPKGKQQCDRCGAWVKEGLLVHDDLAEEAICNKCVAKATK